MKMRKHKNGVGMLLAACLVAQLCIVPAGATGQEEYVPIEYVVADGTRAFNTGYVPNEKTTIVAEYTQPKGGKRGFLFGVDYAWAQKGFSYGTETLASGQYVANWHGTRTSKVLPIGTTLNQDKVAVTMGNGMLYINGVDQKLGANAATAFSAPAPLRIFGLYRASRRVEREFVQNTRLYRLKIYENATIAADGTVSEGTLVHDYTPVEETDGGQTGLRDTVTGAVLFLGGGNTHCPVFNNNLAGAAYTIGQQAVALDGTAQVADSGAAITYQWYRNGVVLDGATEGTLIPQTNAIDKSTYYVVASSYNAESNEVLWSATSNTAVVTVTTHINSVVSDGTNYYDTGYIPTQDTVVVAEYQYPATATEGFLFGADVNWAGTPAFGFYTGYRGNQNRNAWSWGVGGTGHNNTYGNPTGTTTLDTIVALTFGRGKTLYLNGVQQSMEGIQSPVSDFAVNGSMYIFATNRTLQQLAREPSKGVHLYALRIYDGADIGAGGIVTGGTLVRDYIAKETDAGEMTLFETISQTYLEKKTASAIPPSFNDPAKATWKHATYAVGATAATLKGTATALNSTITYQWYKDGQPIAEATEETYLPDTTQIGVHTYHVVATAHSHVGDPVPSSTSSDTIIIGVVQPGIPAITAGAGVNTTYGAVSGTVGVLAATDVGTLSYQWYQGTSATDNVPTAEKLMAGKTANSFILTEDMSAGTYHYFCTATSTVQGIAGTPAVSGAITVSVAKATVEVVVTAPADDALSVVSGAARPAIDATAAVGETAVLGTITWDVPGDVIITATNTTQAWTFTPTDSANHDIATGSVTFTVTEAPPTGFPVTLTNYANKPGATAVVTNLTNGESYSGTTTFTVSAPKACVVAYSTDGGTTYTNVKAIAVAGQANTYSFTIDVTSAGTVAIALSGDVNLNGEVTSVDKLMAGRIASEVLKVDALKAIVTDANKSGTVTSVDALMINRAASESVSLTWRTN